MKHKDHVRSFRESVMVWDSVLVKEVTFEQGGSGCDLILRDSAPSHRL